jgi:two-component system CheB/CheR fusion protein
LEAFKRLLEHLPSHTGISFVLVQHLDPTHGSILSELLSKATKVPVTEVKDGMAVEADHVYVIPPNRNMAISGGVLKLLPRKETRGQHRPIDYFLRSLAEDQGNKAIGVILSGTASDGTLGLAAIKAEGGITFAQDEKSAKYDSMPRSAVAAGCVDFILPPEKIAEEVVRICRHPYLVPSRVAKPAELPPEGKDSLKKILALLRKTTGVNFTLYKSTTLKRRIARRMVLHRIEGFEDYIAYLQKNKGEVEALYEDILINVTSFFRSPEAFKVLKKKVFPKLIKNRPTDESVRIWVVGCSTGEEAYSMAITFLEFADGLATNVPVTIFATDINEKAIEKARLGIYTKNVLHDVSPERRRRFFVEENGSYRIIKPIRDMCVFARQDLTRDPPFSRLDLISCRNLLIYMDSVLQAKIVPTFHYALKPKGFLMLGASETISSFPGLFAPEDKKHRVYCKKHSPLPLNFDFTARSYADHAEGELASTRATPHADWGGLDLQKEADRIVLARYAPAGVLVNSDMEILQFRGSTSPYLEPAPGMASLNLLKMAREGLLVALRTAVHEARKNNNHVRKEGMRVRRNGQVSEVNLEVIPIKGSSESERYFMVLFEPVRPAPKRQSPKTAPREAKRGAGRQTEDQDSVRLQQELAAAREYLQSIIEQHEATNEELQTANEEVQSSNEELQSMNEELETSKEELESANEELTTVNEEMQNRNLELNQLNNDLINLLAGVQIPIVMIGSDRRVRRFTPVAAEVLNLIAADVGRPITNIKLNIDVPNFEELIEKVIGTAAATNLEIQDREGRWYSMRIHPYRTLDNKIDGAVIVLVDVDARKRAEDLIGKAKEELEIRVKERTADLVKANAFLKQEISDRRRAEESVRNLSRRLLKSQDEERRRIARELHDTTAQSLASLEINLSVVEKSASMLDEKTRKALSESTVLAGECSRQLRTMSYLLHPPLLDEVGLPAALKWYTEGFTKRSDVRTELHLPPNLGRMPPDIERTLFRIVQECLTNIHRHSGSPTATVRLSLRPGAGEVTLEVKDQGRGFSAEGLSGGGDSTAGVGIAGMRERVKQLGGSIQIESGSHGTAVKATLPIPKARKTRHRET